jgi:hypothetical protein
VSIFIAMVGAIFVCCVPPIQCGATMWLPSAICAPRVALQWVRLLKVPAAAKHLT